MASEPREVFGDLATTAFVESTLLFRSLDPDARRDLVQVARVVAFAAGEVVSSEGDDGFYLVRDGTAAVVVGNAAPVEIAVLDRGGLFGEARVLGGGVAASLAARTDGAAVVLPAPMVAAVAERFPKVKKLLEALRAARERELAAKRAG